MPRGHLELSQNLCHLIGDRTNRGRTKHRHLLVRVASGNELGHSELRFTQLVGHDFERSADDQILISTERESSDMNVG